MGRLIVTEFMTPDGVAEVEERHDEVHVIGSLDLVQTL
ncbi:MAG: hypothetical protein JWM12_4111 [Ilumatobacteraceae bacterium]|nr:hypothetical protein [Ilumatobacteraceae bacterium]